MTRFPSSKVHKARLRAGGQEVAVKLQYLGLETAVTADLATLGVLAFVAAWAFPNAFDFGWVVTTLKVPAYLTAGHDVCRIAQHTLCWRQVLMYVIFQTTFV
jgi:hypothetical protein